MDYAKFSYIKLKDSETTSNSKNQQNETIEFSNPVINRTINDSFTLDIATIDMSGKSYFQNNLIISALSQCDISVEILLDSVAICTEKRTLNVGENSILSMKAYTTLSKKGVALKVRIKILSVGYSVSLKSSVVAIWGAVKGTYVLSDKTMRTLVDNNTLILSYIADKKIYYASLNLQEQSVAQNQFLQLGNGISHCFSTDKGGILHFFRVDENGNLFVSKYSNLASETLVETNVTSVYASKCPVSMHEDILICYIKNYTPYYRTITNGTIGSECRLTDLSYKFVDINIVDAPNSTRMYVVAKTIAGDNFIFFSEEDGILSGFAERISVGVSMFVERYVNLYNFVRNNYESLYLNSAFSVLTCFVTYHDLFENRLNSNIYLSSEMSATTYEKGLLQEILYTMSFDQKQKYSTSLEEDGVTHKYRITYGGDAAGLVPMKMNLPTNGFLEDCDITDESGWLNRWPFNEIKPCLMQNAQIIGWLNPNDFSKFEDGTSADITSGQYQVMIQFPKVYWKLEEDWDGLRDVQNTTRANITVRISNVPREGYVCHAHTKQGQEYDYIYVSAYESHIENGNVYCCSGKLPTSDITHPQVLAQWNNMMDSQYTTLDYHFTTYLYILSMLLFGDYYDYTFLGNGWSTNERNSSDVEASGVLNTAGMYWGTIKQGYNLDGTLAQGNVRRVHNKLFGLENIWGHSKTYVDGVLWNNNREFLIINPANTTSTHNTAGTGYTTYSFNFTANFTFSNWVTLYTVNNNFGFLPIAGKTVATQKFWTGTKFAGYPTSSYSNVYGADRPPNMMFIYGGQSDQYYGYSLTADRFYALDNIYHNERVMCFPNSKKST